MPISEQLFRSCAAPALLLVLAACGSMSQPAPQAVTVDIARTPVVIAAPNPLCIDPSSLRENKAGAFVLLDACAALGPVTRGATPPPPGNGLVTVSVSPGPIARGEETIAEGLESLRSFLKGPGLPALARSGEPNKVKIDRSFIQDKQLLMRINDPGEVAVPGLTKHFWRGFTQVRGQTVSVSVSTFRASGGKKPDAVLRQVLAGIVEANPKIEKKPITSTALTALAKLNPLTGLLKKPEETAPEQPQEKKAPQEPPKEESLVKKDETKPEETEPLITKLPDTSG